MGFEAPSGGSESSPLLRQELESVTIIAMGGTGPLATIPLMRGDLPFDAKNPVWTINMGAKVYQHTLAWNTHDLNRLAEVEADKKFIDFYKSHDRPLVTLRPVPGLAALIYPIKEIVEHFNDTYFFSAVPYMLAYAGWCNAREIRLFGCDFDYPGRTDYEGGRCCTEYWIGRLRTLGVKFMTPTSSSLFDLAWAETNGRPIAKGGRGYGFPLYGYFSDQPRVDVTEDGKYLVNEPLPFDIEAASANPG